jgi:hypothetical protein
MEIIVAIQILTEIIKGIPIAMIMEIIVVLLMEI